jgi:hypothetical protein
VIYGVDSLHGFGIRGFFLLYDKHLKIVGATKSEGIWGLMSALLSFNSTTVRDSYISQTDLFISLLNKEISFPLSFFVEELNL